MRTSRITFNKLNRIIQFWIPVSPYVRQYRLTERNQKRIERCLKMLDWHCIEFKEMTIYTRRKSS